MDEKFEGVNQTLKEMSASLKIIALAVGKPENKTDKALQYVLTGVSIAGILSIIDIVLKWIIGG
jgi:hypothetical protein